MVAPVPMEVADCARCDAPLMPILYGYPSYELLNASTFGTVVLGGCVVEVVDGIRISPEYICPECSSTAQGSTAAA